MLPQKTNKIHHMFLLSAVNQASLLKSVQEAESLV